MERANTRGVTTAFSEKDYKLLHNESRLLEIICIDLTTCEKLLHMLNFTPYLRKFKPPPLSLRRKHFDALNWKSTVTSDTVRLTKRRRRKTFIQSTKLLTETIEKFQCFRCQVLQSTSDVTELSCFLSDRYFWFGFHMRRLVRWISEVLSKVSACECRIFLCHPKLTLETFL